MKKKKIVFIILAVLFAVSGVTALPSGNYSGSIGCIVIAAALAWVAVRKKKDAEAPRPKVEHARENSVRVLETIRTKLVGVSFDNEDGENRQDILSEMNGTEPVYVEKYTYKGEPAACVKSGGKMLGNLSAELAKDLYRRYPNAVYKARILEITGGGGVKRTAAI